MKVPRIIEILPESRLRILKASAGTGKTFALEHLVVDRIIRHGDDIDRILVMTFTEKATAEMKSRIRELLLSVHDGTETGWDLDDAARDRVRTALGRLSSAPIQTIHAFCHGILQETAFDSGWLLESNVASDADSLVDGFSRWARRTLVGDTDAADALRAWFGSGKSAQKLMELLDRWPSGRYRVQPAWERRVWRDTCDRLTGLDLDEVVAFFSGNVNLNGTKAGKFRRHLRAWKAIADSWNLDRADLQILQRVNESVDGAIDYVKDIPHRKLRPGESDVTAGRPAAMDRLGEIASTLAPLVAPFESVVLDLARQEWEAEKETLKLRSGLLTYDDMIERTARLCGNERMVSSLRRRFTCAFVDEFQDTDVRQWSIFKSVFLDSERHSLTVIGDPKQSIYRFRGADVRIFNEACSEMSELGAGEASLDVNYRSTSGINEFVSEFFEDGFFSGHTGSARVRTGHEKLAGVPGLPPVQRILPVFRDEKPKVGDLLEAECIEVCSRVRELCSGSHVTLNREGLEEQLTCGDILVLAQKRDQVEALADALALVGIRASTSTSTSLFESEESVHFEAWLRWLLDPRSREASSRVLLSPLFEIAFEDVPGELDSPDGSLLDRVGSTWLEILETRGFRHALLRLMTLTGLRSRLGCLVDGGRALANFEHLVEWSLSGVASRNWNVEDCLRQLLLLRRSGGAQRDDLQRLDAGGDAVRVMTVHAAKGLEAKVVFVAGGFGSSSSSGPSVIVDERGPVVEFGSNGSTAEQQAAEESEETRRLTYVALTRACCHLYLFHLGEGQKPSTYPGSMQELIDRRMEEMDVPCAPSVRVLATEDPGSVTESTAAVLSRDWTSLRARLSGGQVHSYTSLKESPAPSVLERTAVEGPTGPRFGICLHEILEKIDFQGVPEEGGSWPAGTRDRIDSILLRHGYEEHGELVRRMVSSTLTDPVDSGTLNLPGGLRMMTRFVRELEFTVHGSDGDWLRGYIDVLFEHEGRLYLCDWKSDVVDPSVGPAVHTSSRYSLQLKVYSKFLARHLQSSHGHEWESRFGGMLYVYLRANPGEGVVHLVPDRKDVTRWLETGPRELADA